MFTTRDGHAPLVPPAQGTEARVGERWLGGGKALLGQAAQPPSWEGLM